MKHTWLLLIVLCLFFSTKEIKGQQTSKHIVIDQFGYLPTMDKVAVLRSPQIGIDGNESYTPGNQIQLVDAQSGNFVYTAQPQVWNGGATDASSGDKAWWFDFSSFTTPGDYYVLDPSNNLKSDTFSISNDVYQKALYHGFRTFFYQRSGYEKRTPFAEPGWADNASHLQDTAARKWDEPNNASLEKNVLGGWYDAGDFNKYTSWTSDYIIQLLRAYEQTPTVWTDDFNIPESGNGTPDIIDEIKWGLDHLLRLQNADGSLVAVVSADGNSPPSTATNPTLYGNVNTSSTLAAAGAYAYASKVFTNLGETQYANQLKQAATKAWDWAVTNPNEIWKNNDAASGTQGIAAGQQEVDDYGRLGYKLRAAAHIITTNPTSITPFVSFIEANYDEINMMQWNYAFPFQTEEQEILLHISNLSEISSAIAADIKSTYLQSMENSADNLPAVINQTDPYRAHIKDYTWGSNSTKAKQALMYLQMSYYNVGTKTAEELKHSASGYLNYLHGCNPLNKVYLSNMNKHGAYNSVDEFYHTWFANGTNWSNVQTSTYGPAPGFLVGGPNPSYTTAACCPNSCGSVANNNKCSMVDLTPVINQPDQKSYMDFNNGWPLNSWSITENSMAYQSNYLRLLSAFVLPAIVTSTEEYSRPANIKVVPNPAKNSATIIGLNIDESWKLYDASGRLILKGTGASLNCSTLNNGVYLLQVAQTIPQTIRLVVQK